MSTCLISHLHIPASVPKAERLECSKQVQATIEPDGADIAPAQTIPPSTLG
jgi:hypothetical protein